MAKEASLCLLFFSSLLISSSGALVGYSYAGAGTRSNKVSSSDRDKRIGASYVELVNTREDFEWIEVKRREIQRKLIQKRRNVDERITNTVYPTPTVITPSDTPTIITVPSSTNPVTISPTNPATAVPVNVPSSTTTPTVPAPVPVPVVTNPVTTSYPPPSPSTSGNVPVPVPVQAQPPPSSSQQGGQSWCVAKTGAAQASLQSALDYACGMGGADCSQIQQGGSCFSPITLQNHASFAFNSYYQKNPSPTSCDFGGAATLVNTNPSSGSCIFPSSSSSSSTTAPMISSPTPPTPTQSNSTPPPSLTTPSPSIPTTYPPSSIPIAPPTSSGSGSGSGGGTSGYGSPPSVLNSSNPASSGSGGVMPAGFGSDSPPVVNTTSGAHSLPLKPWTGCIVLIIAFVTATLSLRP